MARKSKKSGVAKKAGKLYVLKKGLGGLGKLGVYGAIGAAIFKVLRGRTSAA